MVVPMWVKRLELSIIIESCDSNKLRIVFCSNISFNQLIRKSLIWMKAGAVFSIESRDSINTSSFQTHTVTTQVECWYRGSPDSTNFVLPGNCTIAKLCIKWIFGKVFFVKKKQKTVLCQEFVPFRTILYGTIPGIVLSKTILSRDPLYIISQNP